MGQKQTVQQQKEFVEENKESLSVETIGFIGVGTLATAIITGLCSNKNFTTPIYVSPRGKKNASKLQSRHPGIINICASNQEVLDNSEVIFLCVLPTQIAEVCAELKIDNETIKIICSCVGIPTINEVRSYFPAALQNETVICKAIPLPASAHRHGNTILYPEIPAVKKIFHKVGTCVCPEKEDDLRILQSFTCLMGDLYTRMQACQQWALDKGVNENIAQECISNTYGTIVSDVVCRSHESDIFNHLVSEQTPGGVNESTIRFFAKENSYKTHKDALDMIHGKLTGVIKYEDDLAE